MILSLFVALILTPTMYVQLLKPSNHKQPKAPIRWFNRCLEKVTGGYTNTVSRLAIRPFRMMLVILLVGAAIVWSYNRLPSSFLPPEDKGLLIVIVELPKGATTAQTTQAVTKVENTYLKRKPTR